MKHICLLIFALFLKTNYRSQHSVAYNFDKDSLKGFNETESKALASSMHLSDYEFNVKMYQLKRIYINTKYALRQSIKNNLIQPAARTELYGSCINTDFELVPYNSSIPLNQISGWAITSGLNDPTTNTVINSCNLLGCCPGNGAGSSLFSVPITDYYIGSVYPVYSVFGSGSPNTAAEAANPQLGINMYGNSYFRLNDMFAGDYSIEKLSKTFSVTTGNSFFQFAYMVVMAPGHNCCDAGSFQYKIKTASGDTIPCLSGAFITPPTLPDFTFGGCPSGSVNDPDFYKCGTDSLYAAVDLPTFPVYSKWRLVSIDLSLYTGQTVTIDFIATDCDLQAHFAYAYIDAQCGPMKMVINGNNNFFSGNSINLTCCEPTATVTAPSGFLSYQWTGPSGFSSSSQSITTSIAGNYTLTLGETNLCSSTKIVHIDNVTTSTSDSLLCSGGSATLTATGLSSYLWSTGETTSSIVVSPTATATFLVSGITGSGYSCASNIVENVTICTGIYSPMMNGKKITIYPNPNNGEFFVKSERELNKAELLLENTLGQMVYTQAIQQGEQKIKAAGLVPGIYYYTITENKIALAKGKMKID